MKPLKNLSIDELLDHREELIDARAGGEDYHLNQIIAIEEMLLRKFSQEEDNEYSVRKIKEDLIKHLVKYGTYLKTEFRQDDRSAMLTLKKALKYDREIPQAYYRLGFLAYKEEDYAASLKYFQKALWFHKENPKCDFALSKQQQYNANLYLSNCALYIAADAQKVSEKLAEDIDVEEKTIGSLALSPLYELIAENDRYLMKHAYTVFIPSETRYCSRPEYEELDVEYQDHVLLDLAGTEISLGYRELRVNLSIGLAEVLLILMKGSSPVQPAEKHVMQDVLQSKVGELDTNTYSQTIKRIREKFKKLGLPGELIVTVPKTEKRDTAYYYDASFQPYLVIQRTDDIR
ncbi:tetratricopeptide repeat protein [Sporosarcina sp. ACRSM]|uniref:tetratricopeptide repeat protein n=1 Tax=Sporosarcina sp. ACRSM TaxID=2918216 RepID=UPI001EF5CAE5|nr:tetratricopeptide repeat protein [Sporosarcina sp. ACRSM]MCG7337070.1 tetratricopeptide repeat protein [Sporosarcina sp. ACRSM]